MSDTATKRRFRVSLLSLLLLTAVAALTIALGLEQRKTASWQERASLLRDELGTVAVADPSWLYVRGLSGGYPGRLYRWRAYVPPDRWAYANLSVREGEGQAWTDWTVASIGLAPGESSFEFVLYEPRTASGWCYDLRRVGEDRGGGSGQCGPPKPPWIDSVSVRPIVLSDRHPTVGGESGGEVEVFSYADAEPVKGAVQVRLTLELK